MLIDIVAEMRASLETRSVQASHAEEKASQKTLAEGLAERVEMLEAIASPFHGKDLVTMASGAMALKAWTGKTSAAIVYDSKRDPFTADGLFAAIQGRANVAVVGFTTDGDVFGGFHSVAVVKQNQQFIDPSIFAFSFESHGRCATPQRFEVKEAKKTQGVVQYCKNFANGHVWFGVYGTGCFWLGNESSGSDCWNVSGAFDGAEDTTLSGKNGIHRCQRLVAFQLS